MTKFIEDVFKAIAGFIRGLVKDITNYVNRKAKPQKEVVAINTNDIQEQSTDIENEPPLPVAPPLILVECTSCGSIDELIGVCQTCQKPVCSRTFCRKDVYEDELDIRVIQCRNCALTA